MSLPNTPDPAEDEPVPEPEPSTFGDILTEFESAQKAETTPGEPLAGVVVALTADTAVVDIGRKAEGVIPLARFEQGPEGPRVKKGDTLSVVVTGRNAEGYYELSMLKVKRPTDWSQFQRAFESKQPVAGRVAEVVKGGLRVDVGVRAFMPASRSGAKDAAEMEKLIGEEIRCLITKLDVDEEDVVVDRRIVLEQEAAAERERVMASLAEGAVVRGVVRTVADFGAFVDLGGVDGLLHIGDMSWSRVAKASDVVAAGDSVEVKVLKIDAGARRISLGMKQLHPDPFTVAVSELKPGDRVIGKIVRLTDFGAFAEIRPGVDGLIHVSSLTWNRKVRKPSEVVKLGDVVEAVVLEIKPAEKRIALSLKEALGDPWEDAEKKFPPGTVLEEVTVANLAKFGAFVSLAEGLEGMIHIADITSKQRLEHPKQLLAPGQKVRALVLEVDKEKRRIRLGMKQLEPTVMDEFLSQHEVGESLTARVISVEGMTARVELSEGVTAICRFPKPASKEPKAEPSAKADLASLTAQLAQKWKQGGGPAETQEAAVRVRAGEIRSFKIINVDKSQQTIEVALL
jgi:small subunit ribosomal protein S1